MTLTLSLLVSGCGLNHDDDDDDAVVTETSAVVVPTATNTAVATETPTRAPSPTATRAPTATATATVDPAQATLDDIADEWSNTESVHFELDIDGMTYLDSDENIELEGADGDLLRPNSAKAEADVGIGFASLSVDIIIIGDDAYITNFLSGNWENAPSGFDFNPALLFDEEEGLGAILANLQDPELTDSEEIEGRDAVHVTGIVTGDEISDLVAGSLEGIDIGFNVWADASTNQLLRLSLQELDDSVDDPTTWQLDFSDHNEEIKIEAPDV